jgi:hypothetical protein
MLDSFQRTVVIIASVILILCLIVLGILIYNSTGNEEWPPEIGQCPDYFLMKERDVVENGFTFHAGQQCFNEHSLGKKHNTDCTWYSSYEKSKKDKKKWAQGCGLTWDGITNV